jgi:hypothetical protein
MAEPSPSRIHIAHIAATDLTPERRGQLLAMAALFRTLGLAQIAVVSPDSGLDAPLRQAGVDCRIHHFGRLFDLKAEKAIQHELEAFAPHVLQSHSSIAARFVSDHLKAFGPIHAAFTDAMPAGAQDAPGPALRLHPHNVPHIREKGRFIVVPAVVRDLPETAKPYLLAYKTLLTARARP